MTRYAMRNKRCGFMAVLTAVAMATVPSNGTAQESDATQETTEGLLREAKPTAGKQVEQAFTTEDGGTVDYLLYLPKNFDGERALPLLLFLHGRGESYGPLSLVTKWGPPRMAARRDELPYIIVSPQCPKSARWTDDVQQTRLMELLDHIQSTYPVEKSRVYLTGLSLGGYGSWRLAAEQTDRFAAAVIICGAGKPEYAEKLVDLPIWVWHGTEDGAVPYAGSAEMVKAIQDAGGKKIRFTGLEDVGHNAWSAAYASEDTYRWLDRQLRE